MPTGDEPLKLLPVERWRELKALFKEDCPRSISAYGVLDVGEMIVRNGADYGFKVYVPYGNLSSGLVGINVKGQFYEIIIQTGKADTSELVEALRHTWLIHWQQPLQVPFAPRHVVDALEPLLREKGLFVNRTSVTETFYLQDNARYFDVELPVELSFELMTEKYAQICNDTWAHKHTGSIWYYQLLIKAKLGYGLFKNGELVAWCYVKEMGGLGHLYTLEQHRRKGYGQLVLKLISNTLRRDGRHVFAFCVEGNVAARNLYQKLGFSSGGLLHWSDIKPI